MWECCIGSDLGGLQPRTQVPLRRQDHAVRPHGEPLLLHPGPRTAHEKRYFFNVYQRSERRAFSSGTQVYLLFVLVLLYRRCFLKNSEFSNSFSSVLLSSTNGIFQILFFLAPEKKLFSCPSD